ncbi:putative choline transporter [Lupinus albus]|uniref:Putative choline transporter n=1 Tax=Lupinus albus TaxID=3870 RepID=A0A6A4R453_LUPAL|nr:putative choline transporter [Lupinus albus]
MNMREEPNKPNSLYDTSSSHPLLANLPYPSSSLSSPIEENASDSAPYLHISYNHAVFHQNPNYSTLSSFSFNPNTSSCVKPSISTSSSNWVVLLSLDFYSSYSPHIIKHLTWTLVATFIFSLPICCFLLLSLKHYTKHLVYASIPFFIIIPIFLNVYWFVTCTVSSNCNHVFPPAYRILVLVFIFFIIGIMVWILVVNWHWIELTVSIIGVASNALSRNLGLFGVLSCLTIGWLCIMCQLYCSWCLQG